jgi:hypothetical protein
LTPKYSWALDYFGG